MQQGKYSVEERRHIAESTVGQSVNDQWFDLRVNRITASVAHRVVTRMATLARESNTDMSNIVQAVTSHTDISHLPDVAWGIQQESKAKKDYVLVESLLHQNLKVDLHGLEIFEANPFLACSSDGIVSFKCKQHMNGLGNEWLIEIKCPGSFRDKSPHEAAVAVCGVKFVDGKWVLQPNHKYYCQIMMQLGIMGLSHCDFVVHTKQGNLKVNVEFNEHKFQEIINTLGLFGKEYLFPHLISSIYN